MSECEGKLSNMERLKLSAACCAFMAISWIGINSVWYFAFGAYSVALMSFGVISCAGVFWFVWNGTKGDLEVYDYED